MRLARWVLAAAALAVTVLGCAEAGCSSTAVPDPPARTAPPPPDVIVGGWRVVAAGTADPPALFAFLPSGGLVTSDGGVGTWRPQPGSPGSYSGEFRLDGTLGTLTVTYAVTVDQDRLTGSGDATMPGAVGETVAFTGVRLVFGQPATGGR